MDSPLLSIVTVTYNAKDIIAATVDSIIQHKTDDVEYIIIDGASNDGTAEIIRDKYTDGVDIFISEPDNGIYDAMNKAIGLVSGRYFIFINCGDMLLANPLDLIPASAITDEYDLIFFNVNISDGRTFKSKISFASKIANTLHHQGLLYRNNKSLKFDINYKVHADFDLNQRILKGKGIKYLYIDKSICYHHVGGLSHDLAFFHENYDIVLKNFGRTFVLLSFFYFKWQGLKVRLFKLL